MNSVSSNSNYPDIVGDHEILIDKLMLELGNHAKALNREAKNPGALRNDDLINKKIAEIEKILIVIDKNIEAVKELKLPTVRGNIVDRYEFIQRVARDLHIEAIRSVSSYYNKVIQNCQQGEAVVDSTHLTFKGDSKIPKITKDQLLKIITAAKKATPGTSFLSPFGDQSAIVERIDQDQIAFTFPHTATQIPLGQGAYSVVQGVVSLTLSSTAIAKEEQLAIKLVKPQLSDKQAEDVAAQFENERKKLIILHEKGFGEWFMPVPRIVTWISSKPGTKDTKGILNIKYTTTLNDAFKKGGRLSKVNLKTRLEICAKLLNAVDALKKAEIVHGDIKESNIGILIGENGTIYIKVADFGGAKTKKDLDLTNRVKQASAGNGMFSSMGIATEEYRSKGDYDSIMEADRSWMKLAEEYGSKGNHTLEERAAYVEKYHRCHEKYVDYQYKRDLYAMMKVCAHILTGTPQSSSISTFVSSGEVHEWFRAGLEDIPEKRPSFEATKSKLDNLIFREAFGVACNEAIAQGKIDPINDLLKTGYKVDESDLTSLVNTVKNKFLRGVIAKLIMTKLYAKAPEGQGLKPSSTTFHIFVKDGPHSVLKELITYGCQVSEADRKLLSETDEKLLSEISSKTHP